jgi:hypothetical protein
MDLYFTLTNDFQSSYQYLLDNQTLRTQMTKEEQNIFYRYFQFNGADFFIRPKNQNIFELEFVVSDSVNGKELFKDDLSPDDFDDTFSFSVNDMEYKVDFVKIDATQEEVLKYMHSRLIEDVDNVYAIRGCIYETESHIGNNNLIIDNNLAIQEEIEKIIKNESLSVIPENLKNNMKTEADTSLVVAFQDATDNNKEAMDNLSDDTNKNFVENCKSIISEDTAKENGFDFEELLKNIDERTEALRQELYSLRTTTYQMKEQNKKLTKEVEYMQKYVQDLETKNKLAKEEYGLKSNLLDSALKAKSLKSDISSTELNIRSVDVALKDKDYYNPIDDEIIDGMFEIADEDTVEFSRIKMIRDGVVDKETLLPEQQFDLEKLCDAGLVLETDTNFKVYGMDEEYVLNKNIILNNINEPSEVVNYQKLHLSQQGHDIKPQAKQKKNKHKSLSSHSSPNGWVGKNGGYKDLSESDKAIAEENYQVWSGERKEQGKEVFDLESYVDFVQNKNKKTQPLSQTKGKSNVDAFRA